LNRVARIQNAIELGGRAPNHLDTRAIVFLVIALLAALFGFTSVAGTAYAGAHA
jgi:hypothetical protein